MLDVIFARIPTVRARLNALTAIMCLLMAVLIALGLKALSASTDSLRTVYDDRVVPLQQLKTISDMFAVNIVDTTHKVRNQNIDWAEGLRQVEASEAVISREWKAYTDTFLLPEEKALVREVEPLLNQARQLSLRLRELLKAKDEAGLAALAGKELYQTIDPVTEKLDRLVKVQLKVAKQEYDGAVARYQALRWWGALALFIGTVIGLLVASLINGRIMRSLGTEPSGVRGVVEAIAKGRLNVNCPVAPGDRSSVIAYVGVMQRSLLDIVRTIKSNSEELDVAAAQIAQGNMDLSVRTEQTAASMQSAGANVDSVIDRLRMRIESTGEARELTQDAVQVAGQAGSQMARVTSAMQGINDASRRIADILSVIDSIAFQTNILALNAAVEAARAGDQGRGFAVVASEVRTLAQRSAAAAKEIKTLITDAAERTQSGVTQVEAAGRTLQSMVDGVQRLDALTAQLDMDAGQDEANLAHLQRQIHELDRLAQQNAALVEEMAASSEGLKEQAQGLSRAVTVFEV